MGKYLIIGSPGSGKTSLALKLSEKTKLPIYSLDQIFWKPGWQKVTQEEFISAIQQIRSLPPGIIEGCYPKIIELCLDMTEIVIYLDISRYKCINRMLFRTLTHLGRQRPNAPEGCLERFDKNFFKYIWNFRKNYELKIRQSIEQYKNEVIILRSSKQITRFLSEC